MDHNSESNSGTYNTIWHTPKLVLHAYNLYNIIIGEQDHDHSQWYGFKIVGDNVDSKIKPRYMRSDRQSSDLHYFHLYATRDRLDLSGASEEPPSINPDPVLSELLPSEDDRETMLSNFGVLVARQLVLHMPFFKEHFSDAIVEHIPHQHEKEMKKVSEVVIKNHKCSISTFTIFFCIQVPLGVLNKSEMKYDDMIEIMEHVHQYVPTNTETVEIDLPTIDDKLKVTKTNVHTTVFAGDLLTAKRARGSQKIRSNSITPTEQISGLLPSSEDWHARLCLLQVSMVCVVCRYTICTPPPPPTHTHTHTHT